MDLLLNTITDLDLNVYLFLNGYAGRWYFDRLAAFEEGAGLLKGGLFFSLYAYTWFQSGPDQQKKRQTVIATITGTLLALVVCRIIADAGPFRLRPMYDPNLFHRPYSIPISPTLEGWNSFPSDTAAIFSALALGLVTLLPRLSAPLVVYTAVWILLPRLFLGLHYLSDIVVGSAVGMMMAWISIRSEWLRSSVATRVLAFEHTKPHFFYAVAFLVCFEMSGLFGTVRHMMHAVYRIYQLAGGQ